MDKSQLKQRLVGAIVLVALGVIFIPIILDQDDDFAISGSNIPDKPAALEQLADKPLPKPTPLPDSPSLDAEIVDQHSPKPPAEPSSAEPSSPAQVASETRQSGTTKQPETTAATPPVKEGDSRAWVVQVASFTERGKALKLRDRLRKAKYPTFVESVSAKSGATLYRVRVGPVVRRDNADDWKKKIAKNFKLKDALVMVHP